MRAYRVENPHLLPPKLAQATAFETLSDQVLGRVCSAVDAYNNADTSWGVDAAAGERIQRDATATIQGVLDGLPDQATRNRAISEIRRFCDEAEPVLDTVRKPGPGTPPFTTYNPPVATGEPGRHPAPPPPPPNTNPPVATGQRGPGRGAFGGRPTVPTGRPGPGYVPPMPEPPVTTGSEAEPVAPPEPPPTPQLPPPVASVANGCWYVMGSGYSWGPRPPGGESTGLNKNDCEALVTMDRDVRGLPALPPQQAPIAPLTQNIQPPQDMTQNPYSQNNLPGAPSQPADVASTDCGPGRFWDGTKCRGSVSMPGLPGGLMEPGGTPGLTQLAPSGGSYTSLMGPRRVALRGVHSNGNIEWWGYQQTFLPPLYFSRPRVNYATLARPRRALGVGKPVPAGICCQATEDGGAICSTGQGFPPTCPNKPEPNVPGVAKYIQQGSYLVPQPPPVPVDGVCGTPSAVGPEAKKPEDGGVSPVFGIAAIGALLYAATEIL